MRRGIHAGRTALLAASLLLAALPVCAQTARPPKPAKPYRTLFGGTDANRLSAHAVDLTVSLDGGFDSGIRILASPLAGGAAPKTGVQELYSAGAELAYLRRGRRVTGEVRGSTSLPYYSIFPDEPKTLAYGASSILSVVSGRTTAGVFGRFLHSPYYSAALDPGTGPGVSGAGLDRASALNPNDVTSAGASLARQFGRRTSTSVSYALDTTSFSNDERSNRSQGVRGSVQRQVSRRATLTSGYGYRSADYTTGDSLSTSSSHDVDVGFEYNRRSPRGLGTTFRLGVGSSFVDEYNRRYQGWRWSVHAGHAVGTNWTFGANYGRDLRFYGGLQQPVWADNVNASAGGHFGPRVTLTLGADYSNGKRVSFPGLGFDSYAGSARLQVGLTQWVAMTADYLYYRYDFPAGYDLPAGMPPRLDRQRLQIGARLWLPLARAGHVGEPRGPVNQ